VAARTYATTGEVPKAESTLTKVIELSPSTLAE
jgi:hypothetical protein